MPACLLGRLRLGPGKQVKALWLCWLVLHGHVLGSPALDGHGLSPPEDGDSGVFATPADREASAAAFPDDLLGDWGGGGGRGLAAAGDPAGAEAAGALAGPRARGGAVDAADLLSFRSGGSGDGDGSRALAADTGDKGRRLQISEAPWIFFTTAPYANIVVFDSHDFNCNTNYDSPPIFDPSAPGYPSDGTDASRKRDMSCGVAPTRFVFTTSDLPDYEDDTITAKMQVRIKCNMAKFIDSDLCDSVLDATGDFPRIDGCRFRAHEARLILSTRLKKSTKYMVTIKLELPPGRMTAAENSFEMTTEFYQLKYIEGTMADIDLTSVVPNAKDESEYGDRPYTERGYITAFTWQPNNAYSPAPGVTTTFVFGLRSFGVMNYADWKYAIDVIAYPTDIWRFGEPNTACDGWNPTFQGVTCDYWSFYGAPATESNGFRIRINNVPQDNLGKDKPELFEVRVVNPMISVNMYWTATSFRLDSDELQHEAFTVMLDKPISVLGAPTGFIAMAESKSIGADQWVTLELTPGSTIMPSKDYAGELVIIPPESFRVKDSSLPQLPPLEFNALPCTVWTVTQELTIGHWRCSLGDQAVFKHTSYRTMLKVRNPTDCSSGCAARGWRVELWQAGTTKPLAITLGVRGMVVTGEMTATLAPQNQLLGGDNVLEFEFTPSTDLGAMLNTRLDVLAPPGFMIIKRCVGFIAIQLPPESYCVGDDGNGFSIVFPLANSVKAFEKYKFQLDVENPVSDVDESENFWLFDTVRPDGIPRDSTRYASFVLYPYRFDTFRVIPIAKRPGAGQVVLFFKPLTNIPFDDYLRIRAPDGVRWLAEDLGWDTSGNGEASPMVTKTPEVIFETPNNVIAQLETGALANFQYSIRANCNIPVQTPVPNKWWIEQWRLTGLAAPRRKYMASAGADGFKTQALVNARIVPHNIVEEAWQNPTLIQFETTMPLFRPDEITVVGKIISMEDRAPSELYIEAPPDYTYICPLTATTYMPPFTEPLPSDVECVVNHNDQEERNKLHLLLPTGLKANTRYAFTIDVVNAGYTDPARNYFHLITKQAVFGELVEETTLPGFLLAKRMDNTRYYPIRTDNTAEDRVVEAASNRVTFIIGTTMVYAQDTILEVKAPVGFKFAADCTDRVGDASLFDGDYLALPEVVVCQNLATAPSSWSSCAGQDRCAHVTMTGEWSLGNYGLYVIVENPDSTPAGNFWGFTIMDATRVPLMSEAWVSGFKIQEIINPLLYAYNPGNGDDLESAINRVEISFTLTSPLPGHVTNRNMIWLTAPEGFRFPPVCRYFEEDVEEVGKAPLPKNTDCRGLIGSGSRSLRLTLKEMRPLFNQTRYAFRFLVINPTETFTNVYDASRLWRIETRLADWTLVDLNRTIPSFPIYQRLKYFKIDTLSKVGLNATTFRIHFQTFEPLPPQKTIHMYPPKGTIFGGIKRSATVTDCWDEDPVLLSRMFPEPLIAGVTRLPEWVSCQVISPTELMLRNEEPTLGGRPLISTTNFEFFIKNASNAEKTPALNLFRMVGKTNTELGREERTADGWVIFPELTATSVRSSNPGYGLYTNFTINFQTITMVPKQGSIRIIAPQDHLFRPLIENDQNRYDPLTSLPPVQGALTDYPDPNEVKICHILRPPQFSCLFQFDPCVERDEFLELEALGIVLTPVQDATKNFANTRCEEMEELCSEGDMSQLISCSSRGSQLDLLLADQVNLPARVLFSFIIQGYNPPGPAASPDLNLWHFMTRDSDSEKTVLDEKASVPGLDLYGIITVKSIEPSDTMVNSLENYVKITLTFNVTCIAPALLRITYPKEFMRNANAAFQGSAIETGGSFPRVVEKRQSLNTIELEAIEEMMISNADLIITLGLSNPGISPPRFFNIWTFEAYGTQGGEKYLRNVNQNVTGFKIFGEFSRAAITGTVLSPTANNIVAAWFVLKSALDYIPKPLGSQMKIWMPRGFVPRFQCGGTDFKYEYNKFRTGMKNPFPIDKTYFPLPSGTECYDRYDSAKDQYFILLEIDGLLDYGLDYAFEFGITNPAVTPPAADNQWWFETLQKDVILHLQRGIMGFGLEQIKVVTVTPHDTTTLLTYNRIEFHMMTDKFIPGGSTIIIRAPKGFQFTCARFRTDEGLSNTTTCLVKKANQAEFTVDSQDPKQPNTPFTLSVQVGNPEFTPQINVWGFDIIDPLGKFIDIRENVTSFDITGPVDVEIKPSFSYIGERNGLEVVFVQSTILNQADNGNELVLTAPTGYIFPANCSDRFNLRLTNVIPPAQDEGAEYPETFVFPPPGMTCTGFDDNHVVVRLPNGYGLLRNNYTLDIDVDNPGYAPNGSNLWMFETRVRDAGHSRFVDANRFVEGFQITELVALRTDESAAWRAPAPGAVGCLALLTLLAMHAAGLQMF